ncbi:MAG: MFS transporter [Oscillospiraceae bacterium]|nr:MFS transporter [Oscillospiraceae bacterium]
MNDTGKKATIWTRGFILITLCNVFANMAMFSVNTYLTTYMSYLGVGASLAGLIAGLYYAVGLAMRPVAGPMQATLNKKKLMTATYALGFLVNACYALFPSVGLFVAFRLIHGIQLAFYGSLSFTIASASLPNEKMSSGIGIFGLSGIVSQALGPSAGVWAMNFGTRMWGDGGGFRAIFLMSALFSLMSVIPCLFLPRFESDRTVSRSGGVWYKNIIAREALMPSCVISLQMLSAMLFTTYMIPYGAWRGIANIGLYFTVNAVVMVATRPIAGKLTDTYGANVTFYPGMALIATAFLAVSFARSLPLILAAAVCMSIGGGLVSPAVQAMTMQSVSPGRRAVASNTLYTFMDIGNFLGPTLGGIILARSNYEQMFRCALVPLGLAVIIFTAGWKQFLRYKAAAEASPEE